MFFIGYSIFLIASIYQNLFNVLWWSCIFGLLLNVPFQKGEKEKHLLVLKATDLIYREMGITNGHRKYKLGLILYAIGALISWLYYFTESVGSNI
jgi:dolichol kinase